MGSFDEWLRRGKNFNGDKIEYYEDAHNERGEYIGRTEAELATQRSFSTFREQQPQPPQQQPAGVPLPSGTQYVAPRYYQNVVVYAPKTPEDVQNLIDYLRRREPAIINLDDVEEEVSQRVLDFVSGAIYALNGKVHRIAGNIFLLSPEGVDIAIPV